MDNINKLSYISKEYKFSEFFECMYTVSEKDCTLFLFIFLKKVQSFSDILYISSGILSL